LYISHTRDPHRKIGESFNIDQAASELQAAALDMTAEDQVGEEGREGCDVT
jgi:hypothetical protein